MSVPPIRGPLDAPAIAAKAAEVRRIAVALIHGAGSGHPGSCLSVADVLATLYFHEMRIRPEIPVWEGRDRLVLSKGHGCPALYAALHLRGFFPRALLGSFRRLGGALQGEPEVGRVPGVDATCGSLGQGFSIAVGMGMGLRLQSSEARVYAVLGDGELQEGEVWEAAMCAAHHRLSNVCAIVDYNKLQSDDWNERVMRLEPLEDKWRAFGWHVLEADGHGVPSLIGAFDRARAVRDGPTVILAHSLKGRGVGYMEGVPSWHGSVKLREGELAQALLDLGVPPNEQEAYLFHD